MAKKARARFWIVSTHVLTTGIAIPFLINVVMIGAIVALGLDGLPAMLLVLVCGAIGYIGGTYYSLSYLRKEAIATDWSACTVPSIVTFAVLAAVSLGLTIYRLPERGPLAIAGMTLFHIVIVIAFAVITRAGFALNDSSQASRSES